jgi:acyl carrier protein
MREKFELLLEQHAKTNRSEFNDNTSLRDELGLDSLSIAMLYPDIEDQFCLQFSPLEDDLGEIFKTVGSLWRFIEARGGVK